MLLPRWLRPLPGRTTPADRPAASRHGSRRPPRLEALEDRTLLTFGPAVNYAAGYNPDIITAADFNGDGKLDVAAATYGLRLSQPGYRPARQRRRQLRGSRELW
jgi:hypothetical protein